MNSVNMNSSHLVKKLRLLNVVVTLILYLAGCRVMGQSATFCNPLDLDYRFQLDDPVRREAADPAVVRYNGEYWLFASKSGGYWHSKDFCHWAYVEGNHLPIEDYAPAPAVINGQMYYTAFNSRAIYRADDPYAGKWTKVGDVNSYPDPDLFQDDDGRVYIYYGCSADGGINVVELNPTNGFKEIGQPVVCTTRDTPHRGWEVPGNQNDAAGGTWEEGAWMTKHDGKYYLQYASPGTQFHSYADGIFVGTTPKGPFVYAPYSPFSQKPTGFITGAGHSGTFQDADGNWWRVVTMVVSVRHWFERRVGLFPVGFDSDGQMYCNTYLGDYPEFLPGTNHASSKQNSVGWMLLSYNKKAECSSELPNFPVTNAFDENVQTWWSAKTGDAGEWLKVDLGKICRINAMQINFADQGAQVHGKLHDDAYQYYVEASGDGVNWTRILDRSDNHRDAPHDYEQLDHAVKERYLRLVNVHCPAHACFSVSGFRIFGNGLGDAPESVKNLTASRNPDDGRKAVVSWSPATGADFYIVRYGIAPDRLYNNYQVYDGARLEINSLNSGVSYYFTVDAVNDSGVTHTKAAFFLNSK